MSRAFNMAFEKYREEDPRTEEQVALALESASLRLDRLTSLYDRIQGKGLTLRLTMEADALLGDNFQKKFYAAEGRKVAMEALHVGIIAAIVAAVTAAIALIVKFFGGGSSGGGGGGGGSSGSTVQTATKIEKAAEAMAKVPAEAPRDYRNEINAYFEKVVKSPNNQSPTGHTHDKRALALLFNKELDTKLKELGQAMGSDPELMTVIGTIAKFKAVDEEAISHTDGYMVIVDKILEKYTGMIHEINSMMDQPLAPGSVDYYEHAIAALKGNLDVNGARKMLERVRELSAEAHSVEAFAEKIRTKTESVSENELDAEALSGVKRFSSLLTKIARIMALIAGFMKQQANLLKAGTNLVTDAIASVDSTGKSLHDTNTAAAKELRDLNYALTQVSSILSSSHAI